MRTSWRVLYEHGPIARVVRAVASVGGVVLSVGGIAFLAITLYVGAASIGERGLDGGVLLGMLVAVAFVAGMFVHVRAKLRDWWLPMQVFEGKVERLDKLFLGYTEGAGTSIYDYAVFANDQHWTIPERVWKLLHPGDRIRLRFTAGSREVVRLEARTS